MAKQLTNMERRLFKALTEGKTQTEAAREAGYSYPAQAAAQAIERIKDKVPDLFARHGLDDDSFIEKHILPALNAEETKFFAEKGIVTDQRDVIAWGPRTQMIGLVAKMKGLVVEREPDRTPGGIQVLVINEIVRPEAPSETYGVLAQPVDNVLNINGIQEAPSKQQGQSETKAKQE